MRTRLRIRDRRFHCTLGRVKRWLSFRTKLLATYVLLAAAVTGGVLYAVERKLGDDLVAVLDQRLETQATAAASWMSGSGHPPRLAKRLARVMNARVSVIDALGIIEGDSAIDEERLGVDPEGETIAVAEARAGRVGRVIRWSPLERAEMYYLAVPAGQGGRVVRVAVPTAEIRATRMALRNRLLLISLVGFAAALVLGLLATRAVARPLKVMTAQARRLAEGHYDTAAPLDSPDELGVLSRTLTSLAAQVRDRIVEVERARDFLSSVIGALVEGVVVVDGEARILLDNPAARALLEQERGQALADAGVRAVVEGAVAAGAPIERELELRGRALLLSAQPLAHREAAALLVLYDVTRLRRLETLRRDFVANLTHELRTPVTSIRGYAETLLSSKVDDATRSEFLQTLQRNAVRIGALVDDLLVLQELDARPHGQEPGQAVELAPVVADVVRTAQPQADRVGTVLRVEVDAAVRVMGDADRLEQVLLNLVDNAIKYGGGAGREVRVRAEAAGERVRVAVEDDGPGIAAEHQGRVFERFYRVDAGRTREQGGTGLGLAIVKHQVQSMGGEVTLESQAGGGCRFVVSLRAAVAAAAVALLASLSGCRGEPDRITVAVTSGARDVLPDLLDAFEADHPGEVSVLMAGSGTLVDWIEAGTEADLVLLGDEDNLGRLARGGHLDDGSRTAVATHRLVLVAVAPGPAVTFETLDHLPPTQPIAIGNPALSSGGLDARALFQRMGQWDDLRPRMLLRGDVAAALAAARRGQAAAAVVYDTDAKGVPDLAVLDTDDAPPHPALWVAVTATGRRRSRARELAAFLASPAAGALFQAHGYQIEGRQ
jgi:two-component system phosphate regulon sensor histidine kinase PhoR